MKAIINSEMMIFQFLWLDNKRGSKRIATIFDALIFSHQLTDAGVPREQADKFTEIPFNV
jgi:hypothetical protein